MKEFSGLQYDGLTVDPVSDIKDWYTDKGIELTEIVIGDWDMIDGDGPDKKWRTHFTATPDEGPEMRGYIQYWMYSVPKRIAEDDEKHIGVYDIGKPEIVELTNK